MTKPTTKTPIATLVVFTLALGAAAPACGKKAEPPPTPPPAATPPPAPPAPPKPAPDPKAPSDVAAAPADAEKTPSGLASKVLAGLGKLPPGIRLDGDRLELDIPVLAARTEAAPLLSYVRTLELHTVADRFVLVVDLEVP